jgi:hypothetical protein
LATDVRAFYESRFGHDFSHVRVHTDNQAAESARSVFASAYTVGNHIVFDTMTYAPGNQQGRSLLAHELAHVVQQATPPGIVPQANRIGDTADASELAANAISSGLAAGAQAAPVHVPSATIQRAPKSGTKGTASRSKGPPIEAEDVAGIIAEQLQPWYEASRHGVDSASLEGNDEAAKWFLVALGGNLVWAATAFVAPEAALAIRVMSVAGATVGSGTIQQLAKEDKPIGDFRNIVKNSLGAAYSRMADKKVELTQALQAIYIRENLTARNDAAQAEQRRKVAWKFLFGDAIGYDNPAQLEALSKHDIEAVWGQYLPCWESLNLIVTPKYMRSNLTKYSLVCYYRALVSSGVADRAVGVKKKTTFYGTSSGGQINISSWEDVYEFPGGAQVTKTPYPRDFWWGNTTAEVPVK